MPLVYASITPHPPIMIPEVGGSEVEKVKKTVEAMQKLASDFQAAEPETVFLISPHSFLSADKFVLSCNAKMRGDLGAFGVCQVMQSYAGAIELVEKIQSKISNFSLEHYKGREEFLELDHASLVPLYYLADSYKDFKLLVAGFSYASLQEHYAYGQALGKVFKECDKKIAVVASGDLSHRLTPAAPAGYDSHGVEFDRCLVSFLETNNVKGILGLDPDLIEAAGECGLRSIVILLGILSNFDYELKVLSYEGPFGVGYLTAYAEL